MRRLLPALFLFTFLSSYSQSVKVMTYNLRYDTQTDGVNAWPNRKQKVFDLITKYNPDILGVQEALYHQVQDLITARPEYAFVGVGRDDGKRAGEFSAILYRKDRFTVGENNTLWLSETPETPGSKSWDAAITRVASWVFLTDIQQHRRFLVVNTHFDHIGTLAREKSAEILKDRAANIGEGIPVIITGDFNAERSERPYQIMTDGSLIELVDPAPQPEGTYCTFDVNSVPCKGIDYIFVTNEWNADGYKVIKDNDGKYYPSDHLPVMVTLSLTK